VTSGLLADRDARDLVPVLGGSKGVGKALRRAGSWLPVVTTRPDRIWLGPFAEVIHRVPAKHMPLCSTSCESELRRPMHSAREMLWGSDCRRAVFKRKIAVLYRLRRLPSS